MTDTTAAVTAADASGDGHGAEAHHGPTDAFYVRIAIALAVITALEVAWSYLPVWEDASGMTSVLEVGGLLVMMMIKFVIVASNFMHLKFDDKLLSRIFYFGLILAVLVYLAALLTFQVLFGATPGYH